MSTLKVNNLQVGQDGTAANNYTLYQPASPDGTVRLGYGVAGSVTDILTLKNSRLGIGTDNPSRKVEIFDTAATVLQLNSTNSGGTSLRIQNSGTDKMYMGLAGDFITGQVSNVTDSAIRSNGALLFASGGGTEKVRITSGFGGNLLVGMDTVTDVNAVAHFKRGINIVYEDQGGTNEIANATLAGQGIGRILFTDARPGRYAEINCVVDGTPGTNDYPGRLVFRTTPDGSSNTVERMRISSNGNVGIAGNLAIGTNSPSVSLDLASNTDAVSLPTGTTAQRPAGTDAYIRKNSTNNALEFYNGTNWVEIITDYFPTGSTTLG